MHVSKYCPFEIYIVLGLLRRYIRDLIEGAPFIFNECIKYLVNIAIKCLMKKRWSFASGHCKAVSGSNVDKAWVLRGFNHLFFYVRLLLTQILHLWPIDLFTYKKSWVIWRDKSILCAITIALFFYVFICSRLMALSYL